MQLNYKAPKKDKLEADIRESALLNSLIKLNPDEIDEWVEKNISSLDDVKSVMKEVLKTTAYVIHGIRR